MWRYPQPSSPRSAPIQGALNWLEGVLTFQGRQDNLAIRQAAIIALAFNVFMVLIAIMAIMLTVPKGKSTA